MCVASALVVKLQIVDVYGIAVLNAHLFQTGEEAAFAQLMVKVVPGFVVVEVDV